MTDETDLINCQHAFENECARLHATFTHQGDRTPNFANGYIAGLKAGRQESAGLQGIVDICKTQYVHRNEVEAIRSERDTMERNRDYYRAELTKAQGLAVKESRLLRTMLNDFRARCTQLQDAYDGATVEREELRDICSRIYYARIAMNAESVAKQLERIDAHFRDPESHN